jgi:energy-coupling factor transport system permease protein
MDSRGYGRTAGASPRSRRITGAFLIAGMCGLCIGAYGLLDGSALGWSAIPAFTGGAVLCGLGLLFGGRQVRRTKYRPDPWTTPEWTVAVCGMVPAVVLMAGVGFSVVSLNPSTDPLAWPGLPLVPALAIVAAAMAAFASPPPPAPVVVSTAGAKADNGVRPAGRRPRTVSMPS